MIKSVYKLIKFLKGEEASIDITRYPFCSVSMLSDEVSFPITDYYFKLAFMIFTQIIVFFIKINFFKNIKRFNLS